MEFIPPFHLIEVATIYGRVLAWVYLWFVFFYIFSLWSNRGGWWQHMIEASPAESEFLTFCPFLKELECLICRLRHACTDNWQTFCRCFAFDAWTDDWPYALSCKAYNFIDVTRASTQLPHRCLWANSAVWLLVMFSCSCIYRMIASFFIFADSTGQPLQQTTKRTRRRMPGATSRKLMKKPTSNMKNCTNKWRCGYGFHLFCVGS